MNDDIMKEFLQLPLLAYMAATGNAKTKAFATASMYHFYARNATRYATMTYLFTSTFYMHAHHKQ